MVKNYQIRRSFEVLKRIIKEFQSIELDNEYYMHNIGLERTLDRIGVINQLLYGLAAQNRS